MLHTQPFPFIQNTAIKKTLSLSWFNLIYFFVQAQKSNSLLLMYTILQFINYKSLRHYTALLSRCQLNGIVYVMECEAFTRYIPLVYKAVCGRGG